MRGFRNFQTQASNLCGQIHGKSRLPCQLRDKQAAIGYPVGNQRPGIRDATISGHRVYAYPLGALPGMYARTLPTNPDAVGIYAEPVPKVRNYVGSPYTGPNYSFLLMIKRTDNESVRATLRGDEYEGSIAWENLKACSSSSSLSISE